MLRGKDFFKQKTSMNRLEYCWLRIGHCAAKLVIVRSHHEELFLPAAWRCCSISLNIPFPLVHRAEIDRINSGGLNWLRRTGKLQRYSEARPFRPHPHTPSPLLYSWEEASEFAVLISSNILCQSAASVREDALCNNVFLEGISLHIQGLSGVWGVGVGL